MIAIDILKKEIEEKLPHWLSPVARFSGELRAAIVKKHLDKWLAEEAKKKGEPKLPSP